MQNTAARSIRARRSVAITALAAIALGCFATLLALAPAPPGDPLPSWNDGAAKTALLSFVEETTREGGPQFVPASERIAVFDNDGTLWGEQPMYVQLAFALDRVRALAPQHPEWAKAEPFKSVLDGDFKAVAAGGEHAIVELIMATHAGMTSDEFATIVTDWLATARHPKTGRLYTQMVYQPMLELLAHLRASGFKTFIVSGGGIEFMRPWTEAVYGIPPEQVVGSSIKTRYELRDGRPVLVRLPEVNFIDDKSGKPVGINQHIGRRPILAFGNSDGDQQMLEWTAGVGGDGSDASIHDAFGGRLMGLVHHTDAEREWAYGRDSSIGRLDKALDEAERRGWTVVDMKRDWAVIYPPLRP